MIKARILKVGRVIDGTGGPIQRDVFLAIKGDRIAGIKGVEADATPRKKDVEDLSGYTILPPLVDAHVHLCMSGSTDGEIRRRQLSQSYEEAKQIIHGHLEQHLACGILAVRDGGDYGGFAHRYRRELSNLRDLPVVLQSAGRAWHAPGRYGGLVGRVPLKGHTLAYSVREAREEPDVLKIVNSGINSLSSFGKETPPQFRSGELKAAVSEGAKRGLKTMVHANGYEAVKEAVEAGCHSIEHGFFMGPDNLKLMSDLGTVWVPTVFTMEAYARALPPGSLEADTARRTLDHQLDQIRLAGDLGVTIAVGTDAGSPGVHHGHAVGEEIRLLMEAGISPERAVQCATFNGASLLGIDRDMGILGVGMPATFLAVRGGPEHLPDALASKASLYIKGKALGDP